MHLTEWNLGTSSPCTMNDKHCFLGTQKYICAQKNPLTQFESSKFLHLYHRNLLNSFSGQFSKSNQLCLQSQTSYPCFIVDPEREWH